MGEKQTPVRGTALLLEHVQALGRVRQPQAHALERLNEQLGEELATRLVKALSGRDYGTRRCLVA